VRPILENGAACWDPYRERQINALDLIQNKAVKFADHRNDSNWETLAQRGKKAHICALFKAFTGGRLQRPCYLSRVDHDRKIRSRK
jgi:hypothetical protein